MAAMDEARYEHAKDVVASGVEAVVGLRASGNSDVEIANKLNEGLDHIRGDTALELLATALIRIADQVTTDA